MNIQLRRLAHLDQKLLKLLLQLKPLMVVDKQVDMYLQPLLLVDLLLYKDLGLQLRVVLGNATLALAPLTRSNKAPTNR